MGVTIAELKRVKTKGQARDFAILWKQQASKHGLSWAEVFLWGCAFTKIAKRFRLVREFQENGII